MKPLKKAAIFLLLIGLEHGRSIIALMDNNEIKAIVAEISSLINISQETQETVWNEFKELGYEDNINPAEALYIIRSLFTDSKISDQNTKRLI